MTDQPDPAWRQRCRERVSGRIHPILLLVSLTLLSCKREAPPPPEGGLAARPKTQAPKASSPDRLADGKLLEGEEEAFGFRFPRDMNMTRTQKTARASGEVNFDDLSDYVKDRIVARHAEMFGARLEFPRAKIRGNQTGVFKISVLRGSREQVLLIQDETPRPATVGLSEEQRWKEAGLKPNGELVDPQGMQ